METEVPSKRDFSPAFAIMELVADAPGCAKRLRELADKAAEAKELIKQANEQHAALDARQRDHDKRLRAELAAHEHHMAKQIGDWETTQAAREKDLKLREAHADRLLAKAQEEFHVAARLQAELQKRFYAVRAAAAA
jgi:hypothetical protein